MADDDGAKTNGQTAPDVDAGMESDHSGYGEMDAGMDYEADGPSDGMLGDLPTPPAKTPATVRKAAAAAASSGRRTAPASSARRGSIR